MSKTGWFYQPGFKLELHGEKNLLLQYRLGADCKKPHFHPLCTPAGVEMTAFEPWDHVWHRGIWFAWKYINGVNFWEETPEGKADGKTIFKGPESIQLSEKKAVIKSELEYIPPDGKSLLHEKRQIVIHTPTNKKSYFMDWKQEWAALADITLDRTPLEKASWGGYAGLSWRAARTMGKFKILNSEGQKDGEANHKKARWIDLSGDHDGDPVRQAGIAIFDHPQNPRHPTHWYSTMQSNFGYINPAFLLNEPFRLSEGESLTLQYRILIHDGVLDAAQIEREYQAYIAHESFLQAV